MQLHIKMQKSLRTNLAGQANGKSRQMRVEREKACQYRLDESHPAKHDHRLNMYLEYNWSNKTHFFQGLAI